MRQRDCDLRGSDVCDSVFWLVHYAGRRHSVVGVLLEFPSEVLWEHIAFAGTNQ